MDYKKAARKGHDSRVKKYADGGSVGLGEKIARYLSDGRDEGQRALYNKTRAGLWNSETPPDDASPMGGLSPSLKTRRLSNMLDAVNISNAVPRRKD